MGRLCLAAVIALLVVPAQAQDLDVGFPIAEDGQAAGCAGSVVAGLDPGGDGFLAVRSGPGSSYRKLDELVNGDMVRTCARSGPWWGVYYGQPRRVGWVHGNWLVDGAG
ncbi:SH3 domain-containing protein [Histidinibacterium aquaticum]|nr:SH3 domain-containing protein [Histidinibacterium aquaticum]